MRMTATDGRLHINDAIEKLLPAAVLSHFCKVRAILDEDNAIAIARGERIMRHHHNRDVLLQINFCQVPQQFRCRCRIQTPCGFIRKISFGLVIIARALATRCRWPILSSLG